MKRREQWKIRQVAPSKGKKRFRRRRAHRRLVGLPTVLRSEKVQLMTETLKAGGWTFVYSVQARSPRGFEYEAKGESSDEAFLKAFGVWRDQLLKSVPEIVPRPVPPARKTQPSGLAWVRRRYGQKIYMRRYIRKYRRRENESPDGVLRASWERPLAAA